MAQKRLFEVVRDMGDEGVTFYEAVIKLPDDGTLDSERFLAITVEVATDPDGESAHFVGLEIRTPKLQKRKSIGGFQVRAEPLADLLYPTASLKTIKIIVPN